MHSFLRIVKEAYLLEQQVEINKETVSKRADKNVRIHLVSDYLEINMNNKYVHTKERKMRNESNDQPSP